MELSGSNSEYRPPKKKRRETKKQSNMSPVHSTSSESISTHDLSSDLDLPVNVWSVSDLDLRLPVDVSHFKLIHLDRLGIFYAEKAEMSLENLLEKSMACVVEIPELDSNFKFVTEFLKDYLFFNVSHYKDHIDEGKLRHDMQNIHENLNKLKNFHISEFLSLDVNKSKELQLVRVLENVHVASLEFLEMLIYFMDEESKDSGSFCMDMMYRELFSTFFPACGLSVRAGECVKKNLILSSGDVITSVPKLRCRLNSQMFNRDTMMVVGEVKRRKWEIIESENFSIVRDLGSYDVLGPMGAELLVELQDTCFCKKGGNRVIFGAVCAGTQIIFTSLEMTRDHFEAIVEYDVNKWDKDDLGKAVINYTRPYDLLKAADRQLLYEPLLRLACVQKHL